MATISAREQPAAPSDSVTVSARQPTPEGDRAISARLPAMRPSEALDLTLPTVLKMALGNQPHPLFEGMVRTIMEPLVSLWDPPTALTDKLFPEPVAPTGNDFESKFAYEKAQAQRQISDLALKTAPLWAPFAIPGGPIAGGVERAVAGVAPRAVAQAAGGAVVGGAAGAVSGATAEAVKGEPILPGAAAGAIGGGVLGGLISFTPGALAIAERLRSRIRGDLPDAKILDELLPMTGLEPAEQQIRGVAASKAFRARLGLGSEDIIPPRESMDRILWARALSDARQAAGGAVRLGQKDAVDIQGDIADRLLGRAYRLENPTTMSKAVDFARKRWGQWVTNTGATLIRDRAAFGDVGERLVPLMLRREQLYDHIAGRYGEDIWKPMVNGLTKESRLRIDAFLNGEGGKLSADEMAAAMAWRKAADQGFDVMSGQGIEEWASSQHPATSGSGYPFSPSTSTTGQQPIYNTPVEGGYRAVPLQYRSNYVPYYRDQTAMSRLHKSGSPERAAIAEKLVQSGEAGDLNEAYGILDQELAAEGSRTPLYIRGGPMQHERELKLDFPRERDFAAWSLRWGHDMARRTADAQVFGPRDEKFLEIIQQLKEQKASGELPQADPDRLMRIFRQFIRRPTAEMSEGQDLAKLARTAVAVTHMGPRTGALQFLQLSSTAARMGWHGLLEGLSGSFRYPELRAAIHEVGALLPSEHLLTEIEPFEKFGRNYMDFITNMPRMDRAVRIPTAVAGGVKAQQWAREYYQLAQEGVGPVVPQNAVQGLRMAAGIRTRAERMGILQRRLEETLNIPVSYVLENRGVLPLEGVMEAMRSGSHSTQFRSGILDLPEMKNSPEGRIFFILRNFAKQQSGFVKKLASDAVYRGDSGPLIRYLMTYPALYMAQLPLLNLLSSRDLVDQSNDDAKEKLVSALEGAIWTGMFGGIGDFITQMSASDVGRTYSYFLGPAVGLAAGTAADVGQAVTKGNTAPLIRRAIKYAPGGPVYYPFVRRYLETGNPLP